MHIKLDNTFVTDLWGNGRNLPHVLDGSSLSERCSPGKGMSYCLITIRRQQFMLNPHKLAEEDQIQFWSYRYFAGKII